MPPEEATGQLAPLFQALLGFGPLRFVVLMLVLFAFGVAVALIRRQLATKPGARAPGPPWVAASLITVALYALARLLDPLLRTLNDRPPQFPEGKWAEIGWFEWKLFDRPWAWGILPLSEHPEVALFVHLVVWFVLIGLVQRLLAWAYLDGVGYETSGSDLPPFYRWVGASTARRADKKFRSWAGWLVFALIPLHAMTGFRLTEETGWAPAPGSWVIGGLLLWIMSFHLLAAGKRPTIEKDKEEEEEADAGLTQRMSPLDRLRPVVEEMRPGAHLVALEQRELAKERRSEFPAAIGPLVRELFEDLTDAVKPFAHQQEVLKHLCDQWTMASHEAERDAPTLEEETVRSPIARASTSTPHALMLASEGAGRTTLTLLACVHVFLDRGATSLVVTRDVESAQAWAGRLRDALAGSSTRWNVQVAVAGQDLASTLMADRTPSVVVADLEAFEAEVLCDARTSAFLERLGLVVAEDLDGMTGVAEMHLQMCMRRLWALLHTLHRAPYPVVLLATAGPLTAGLDVWANHVLGVPLRIFDDDGAPFRGRVLLRRRDLVDGTGRDLPLQLLAEACDKAELPWHLRLAGDANRRLRRAELDLGGLRRHHCDDPLDAAVVIVEGTYPDVRREADRLAHGGLRQDLAPVLLVLAPPADEEMVLHEEAEDAANRDLIASLPVFVTLSEPRVVRQRHFDRSLGREQDLAGLRERFGTKFVTETIESLAAAGKIVQRQVMFIDPRTDDVAQRTLVRASQEVALGRPIDAACVTEPDSCRTVVDAGTSEALATVDGAVADAAYPPGWVFLHARGRYMVIDEHTGGDENKQIRAEHVAKPMRTTPDRTLEVFLPTEVEWSDRQLGGRKLRLALVRTRVRSCALGMRRFAPGPKLIEHREYEHESASSFGTDVCLVSTMDGDETPEPEALVPLVAAIRMMLPCYLRACEGLVDVAIVDVAGVPHLCFYDRTPGASGFARFLCERGMGEILKLARLVLERLVGPEFARLRHIHDRTPATEPEKWKIGEALRWIDGVLDPPPKSAEEELESEPIGPRVEYQKGEGHGDLGRLWLSRTGRADDLVWTRHTWWSDVELGDTKPGKVFFDVAVERQAIAHTRRSAATVGGPRGGERGGLSSGAADAYRLLVTSGRADLHSIRGTLEKIAGGNMVSAVLGLVAGIPLTSGQLSMLDRAPLVVLARRRADLEAKLLVAMALLPEASNPSIVRSSDGQHLWLQVRGGSVTRTLDLRGPRMHVISDEYSDDATEVLGSS